MAENSKKSTTQSNVTKLTDETKKKKSTNAKMKVQTRVVKTVEAKKTLSEKIEERFGIEINISWVTILKISIVATIIIAALIFGAYTSRITDIEVNAGKHYSAEQIEDMVVDGFCEKNAVYLFLKYRYGTKKKIPFVEYIDVELLSKNKVRLVVYDKGIIGCTEFMNEYIYFDKDGTFVEASEKKNDDVPYITGINFKNISLYNEIDVDNDKMFEVIIGLTQQINKYKLDIKEINFDKDYNVTLYADNITVLLGKKDIYDEQLAQLPNMIKEADKKQLKGTLHLENYTEGQKNVIFDKE